MSIWDVPGAHESGDEYGMRATRVRGADGELKKTPQPPRKPPTEKKPVVDPGDLAFALRGLRALATYKTWRDKPMFREVIAAAIRVLEEVSK